MRALFILFSFILCILAYQPLSQDQFAPPISNITNMSDQPFFTRTQLGLASKDALHSSNVLELSSGDLLVSWFAGSREGHRDVGIYTQRFNQNTKIWEPIQKVTDASQSSNELNRFIKKVGNAVITELETNHLIMYYVTVSIGGWATSQVNAKHSFDGGHSWKPATRLVVAPFFNISTLVRAHPVKNINNDIWLPAYYELANTSGLMLKLDEHDNVHFSKQIPTDSEALAPVLLVNNETSLHVIQRPKPSGNIHSTAIKLNNKHLNFSNINAKFSNPNASIDAIVITKDLWLMAYNPLEHNRSHLGLAISLNQGASWTHKQWIETDLHQPSGHSTEFSYPSLTLKKDGTILLSYTHNRTSIILSQFNPAWLMSEVK